MLQFVQQPAALEQCENLGQRVDELLPLVARQGCAELARTAPPRLRGWEACPRRRQRLAPGGTRARRWGRPDRPALPHPGSRPRGWASRLRSWISGLGVLGIDVASLSLRPATGQLGFLGGLGTSKLVREITSRGGTPPTRNRNGGSQGRSAAHSATAAANPSAIPQQHTALAQLGQRPAKTCPGAVETRRRAHRAAACCFPLDIEVPRPNAACGPPSS